MEHYIGAFKKYFDFAGRASRKDYWMFFLFDRLVILSLIILTTVNEVFAVVCIIYLLGSMIPELAIAIRRLHDTGRSGRTILIQLIPIVGPIILLVFLCEKGNPNLNEYGVNNELQVNS